MLGYHQNTNKRDGSHVKQQIHITNNQQTHAIFTGVAHFVVYIYMIKYELMLYCI